MTATAVAPRRRTSRRPLTADEQRLVLEFDPFVFGVVHRVPADARRYYGGDDAVAQDVRFQVMLAVLSFDPSMGRDGPMPFSAFAHLKLARWIRGYTGRARDRGRVWRELPTAEDADLTGDLPDHRDTPADPALRAWLTPEYVEQRRGLDWQARVFLYLHTVEGMTPTEAGAAMGLDGDEARNVAYLATSNLSYLRRPTPYDSRPTTARALDKFYKRGTRPAATADGPRTCSACPAPATPGRSCCEVCRVRRREKLKAQHAARAAAGLCPAGGCTAAPLPGRRYCDYHHEQRRRANLACTTWRRTGTVATAGGA